jgi:hypothetical protein
MIHGFVWGGCLFKLDGWTVTDGLNQYPQQTKQNKTKEKGDES